MKLIIKFGATMKTAPRKHRDGFSLIEALMATFILGFGLLAVAKFQTTLVSNSDTSKHRTEATRLAQEKMEQLRTFEQLTTAAGKVAYADVVTGEDTVTGTSNTTYTRAWTVTDSTNAAYKAIVLRVTWIDRNNESQNIQLRTAVARLDPKTSGSLIVAPEGSPVKNPKDRSLNIPVPAVSLNDSESGFAPPGTSGFYFVFNNATGAITSKCTGSTGSHASSTCTSVSGYVVSGYVSFDYTNNPDAKKPSSAKIDTVISMTLTQAAAVSPNFECYDDGATTSLYTDTVTYTCIVYPLDHDGNASTALRWSGAFTLSVVGRTLGTTTADLKICRYTYDYDKDGTLENSEHPSTYTDVTESLENQNFLVVKGSEDCPDDDTIPSASTPNYNTTQYQP